MASSMLQVFFNPFKSLLKCNSSLSIVVRHSSARPKQKPKRGTIKHRNIINSRFDSLAARGFLRSYKPYTPPQDVKEIVQNLFRQISGENFEPDLTLSRKDKFTLLNSCFQELNHSVPNSLLHKIVTYNDVLNFYQTPVSTTIPYDDLKNKDLPPNLHIQYDYVRFNPETDTRFKGISAFPRSSTIVTGIKSKEKYKGYKAAWPYLDAEVRFEDKDGN